MPGLCGALWLIGAHANPCYWLYQDLKARGVERRFVLYPDEGHVFEREANQRDVLSRVIPWADAHLQ
jgi:dipeptidyl aminopeptidase/acylaminoacyl peptidase